MFPLFATGVNDTGVKFAAGLVDTGGNHGVIDTGGKFAAGVVDTSGKFAAGINDTRRIGGKFAAGVNDTDDNFATSVVDTSGKFATSGAPWLANISENFRKIWNNPNAFIRGLGEDDSRKKPEAKNLVTLSL